MIITIDGPAGSGKSTIATLLAKKLKIIHFNSGSLFRGIAAHLRRLGFNFELLKDPTYKLPPISLKVEYVLGTQLVYVNNFDYTPMLRDNEISKLTPAISMHRTLRDIIDDCQRKFCSTHNVVIDGRDAGSHVFPDADFKFYLDCDINERARRRYHEEINKGKIVDLEQIKKELIARDRIDMYKSYAPLVIPAGSVMIDSSDMTQDEVVECVLSHITEN